MKWESISIGMNIINRSGVDDAVLRTVAQHAGVADESFLGFLDDAVNSVVADPARAKLEEYSQKGWKYIQPAWEEAATGERDVHGVILVLELSRSYSSRY